MGYFVTGATGFIGRFLVTNLLLKRKGPVHVLVRKDSMKKLEAIGRKMGWDMKRVVAVEGDMTRANCGSVLILDTSGQLLGILTERDLMTRVLAKALNPQTTQTSEVMTPNPHCVEPHMKVSEAVLIMIERGFRHLSYGYRRWCFWSAVLGAGQRQFAGPTGRLYCYAALLCVYFVLCA